MLSTVTQTYTNPNGASMELPAWQFSYVNQPVSFSQNISWSQYTSPALAFTDINGDALTDIEVAWVHVQGGTFNDRDVNLGAGIFDHDSFVIGSNDIEQPWADNSGGLHSIDAGVRLMDINSDMLPDVVVSSECIDYCGAEGDETTSLNGYYLNIGNSQWQADMSTSTFAVIFRAMPNTSTPRQSVGIIGNVDGDAVQDIHTFDAFYWANSSIGNIFIPNFAQLVDLNNDGLDDRITFIGATTTGVLNVGGSIGGSTASTSFAYGTTFTGFQGSTLEDGQDKGVRVVDVNNDALPDVIRAYTFTSPPQNGGQIGTSVPLPQDVGSTTEMWLNTGAGWTKIQNPPFIPIIANPYTSGLWWGDEHVYEVADIDGSGAADIPHYKNNTPRQDLLNRIVLPTGAIIYATSTPTAQQTTAGNLNHPTLPINVWTVTELTRNDGDGNIESYTYTYKDGDLWYGGINDRKFAVFASTTEARADGKTVTYYHQSNSSDSSQGEYADNFAKIGKAYRIEDFDGSNNLYSKAILKWDHATTSYGTLFPKLVQKVSFAYDGDADHKEMAETYSYNDTNGRLTQKKDWGEVTGSDDGTFSDTASDTYTHNFTYATNASLTPNLLASHAKLDNSSATSSEARYYYDNQSLGSLTLGNRTKIERRIGASTFASTTRTFNSYGLPTEDKDERSKSTTYVYDSFNLYPATTTNALSHSTAHVYNYAIGLPATTTDANGRVWTAVYDGLGRILEEGAPDPTSGTKVVKSTFAYIDTALSMSVQRTDYLSATNTVDAFTHYDGLGRSIQTKREAEDGNWITKDRVYDLLGRLNKESLPYFTANSSKSSAATTTSLLARYTYDTLGRVTTEATAVGTTTTAYDDWKKTVTDPLGKSRAYYNDAYQNLSRVDELTATSTYTTLYTWDGNSALTSITDALGNVRSLTYDKLGRRTQATDLHASGDGTYGTWSYTYDVAGNLTSRTDPKSQVVNFTYDAINQMLTEDYTGQAGTEITYTYNSCSTGKGRLCIASSMSARVGYAYNPLGLVASASTTVSGIPYTVSYAYDRQSNITDITYPDNSAVKYTYDNSGLLEKMERKPANSPLYLTAISELDYAPTGAVTLKRFGNGVVSTYTYNQSALYRLININTFATTTESGGSLGLLGSPFSNFASAGEIERVSGLQRLAQATFGTELAAEHVAAEPEKSAERKQPGVVTEQAISDSANPSSSSVRTMHEGKSAREWASTKGSEIAKLGVTPRVTRKDYDIEVVSMRAIEGGVEAFVRAWNKEGQIGFGKDGTVETERLRIFNPPILVEDKGGDILQTWMDEAGEPQERRLREDLQEALLQVLEHNLSVMKNVHGPERIVAGKRGNTTSTFYPAAGANSPVDGVVANDDYPSGNNYSNVRNAGSGTAYDATTVSVALAHEKPGSYYFITRFAYLFDTSAIGSSSVINSATLSVHRTSQSGSDTDGDSASIVASNPASNSDLAAADYSSLGTTKFASDIAYSSLTASQYHDWGLNSSGLSNINKTGISKLGMRSAKDISATQPTGGNQKHFYFADQAGTTQDPKLVVEHEAGPEIIPGVQSISFDYDAVGNITQISDTSSTTAEKTMVFAYDDLHRLTFASTTVASSTPFRHSLAYNALGNITAYSTSSAATTTYSYTGTAYANPHAPTSIGGKTHTYDNNGNLTSASPWTYAWDYRNRLTSAGKGTATSTFWYDHNDQRVRMNTPTASTTYPNKYFQLDRRTVGATTTATTTAYIFLPDGTLVATIEGNGAATSTSYIHPDHLGSTNAVTDADGVLVQTLDYYPYGGTRIDAGTDVSKREYIGQFLDEESGLSYLNARYYDGGRGQFLSQDPTHLAIGNTQQVKQLTGIDQQTYLTDPQSLGSYSYARNNPIVNKDPEGNFAFTVPLYYAAVTAPQWAPAATAGIEVAPQFQTVR